MNKCYFTNRRVVIQNKQQQDCCVQIRGEEQGSEEKEVLYGRDSTKTKDDLDIALNENLTSVCKMDQGNINNGNGDMRWSKPRWKQSSRNLIYPGWWTQRWKAEEATLIINDKLVSSQILLADKKSHYTSVNSISLSWYASPQYLRKGNFIWNTCREGSQKPQLDAELASFAITCTFFSVRILPSLPF